MMTDNSPGKIVDLLQADHEQVKALFSDTAAAAPGVREDLWCHLVTELVRHEVAEEVVVYPAIRSDAPDGAHEVEPRLEEQAEAEQKLAEMEKMSVDSPEFSAALSELQRDVLLHAQAEEVHIFPLLRSLEGNDTLLAMGARYEKAKASAPTHPHPHAPDTPPGNKVLGPIAAMFDKARDAAKRI
jgi:hemerythrin superfamily protein